MKTGKFLISLFLLGSLCLLPGFVFSASEENEPEIPKKEIYILPHADDEMFMAGSIARAVYAKQKVYVVLSVNGDNTIARYKINGQSPAGKRIYCPLHKKYHNPELSDYDFLAEKEDLVEAREHEFVRSMERLGVKLNDIIFVYKDWGIKVEDGKMTDEQAEKIITKAYEFFGEAKYITVHADLKHNDHIKLFTALSNNKEIKDKTFFVEDEYQGRLIILNKQEYAVKKRALNSYFIWNPWLGDYAVGAHSVYDMLIKWMGSHFEHEVIG